MNAKIYMLLAVAFVTLLPGVYADPANDVPGSFVSPANIVVNYQINTVTDFTVHIVDPQTQLNFSSNRDGKLVEPTGQNTTAVPPIPWATVENRGEVIQSFKSKLGAINTGTTVYISNTGSSWQTLSTTATSPTGWTNVAACPDSDPGPNYLCAASPGGGGTVNAYLRANFTNAPAGTGTLTIST